MSHGAKSPVGARWWIVLGLALVGVGALLKLPVLLLLVPAAGVALVRARTRESSVLLLVASGTVAGTVLFWLALWALLRVFQGPVAGALAVGLVVTVAMLVWRLSDRTDIAPLQLPSRAEVVGLVVLCTLVFFSILHTSTSLLDFSETMIFHVPLVASMERGNVPPIDLQEPPHPLYYHYGQHALAAAVASLGPVPSALALFLTNAWFGALAAAYAYALGRRAGGVGAGFSAAVLLVGAGTFNWVTAVVGSHDTSFAALMNPLGSPFATGNIAIGSFAWRVHGNSIAWATCVALLVCDLFERGLATRRLELGVATGVALSVLAPANETLFAVVAASAALVVVAGWLLARRLDWRQAAVAALVPSVGVVLVFFTGGVMKTFLLEGSATHGASLIFDWRQFGTVASWDFGGFFPAGARVPIGSLRFLQDVGPLPFLVVPALLWSVRRDTVTTHLGLGALVALALGSALTLSRYPENTYRFVNLCVLLSSVPVGVALAAWPARATTPRARATRALAVAAAVGLCVVNWPLLHVGVAATARYGRQLIPPAHGGDRFDPLAIAFLRSASSFDQGVLSLPLESWGVLGSGQVAPAGSYIGGREAFREQSARAASELDLELMRTLGVRYLYVEPARVTQVQRERLDAHLAAGRLRPAWTGPASQAIYEL